MNNFFRVSWHDRGGSFLAKLLLLLVKVSVIFALVLVALVGGHAVLVGGRGSHVVVEFLAGGHHVAEVIVHEINVTGKRVIVKGQVIHREQSSPMVKEREGFRAFTTAGVCSP